MTRRLTILSAPPRLQKNNFLFNQCNNALAHKVLRGTCQKRPPDQALSKPFIHQRGDRMTRIPSLACTTAALLLTFGMAMAADKAEAEPAQPAATSQSENQPKPEETTADTTPSQGNAAKAKEEPACE
jgi:hypothetical protein